MEYVIELRQVSEYTTGLITQKGKVLKFENNEIKRK